MRRYEKRERLSDRRLEYEEEELEEGEGELLRRAQDFGLPPKIMINALLKSSRRSFASYRAGTQLQFNMDLRGKRVAVSVPPPRTAAEIFVGPTRIKLYPSPGSGRKYLTGEFADEDIVAIYRNSHRGAYNFSHTEIVDHDDD